MTCNREWRLTSIHSFTTVVPILALLPSGGCKEGVQMGLLKADDGPGVKITCNSGSYIQKPFTFH
jgi:hypothetical protein